MRGKLRTTTTTTKRTFSFRQAYVDIPLTISDICSRVAGINTTFTLTSHQQCQKWMMTCQFLSYQSFSGKQCVSLASTWTQSSIHSSPYFSTSAWWTVCDLKQREQVGPSQKEHRLKSCTDLGPGVLTHPSLTRRPGLMSTSSVGFGSLFVNRDNSNSLPRQVTERSKWLEAYERDL